MTTSALEPSRETLEVKEVQWQYILWELKMSINNVTWDTPQDRTLTVNSFVITQDSNNAGEFMAKASSYLQSKIGVAIHNYYFPVIVIVGITGNILRILVMIRPHNRHISTCVYMACLSVSDTILIIYQGYSHLDPTHF